MIYLSADHHFYHENIIKLCNRPFKDIDEMNRSLIRLWNSVVKQEDIVFYLGDFGFGTKEKLREINSKLNGKKILIKGNHDKGKASTLIKTIGFDDIYDSIKLDKFLLTHKPVINIDKGIINVHGHIHNANINQINGYKLKSHFCVSVECTEYTPVSIDFIKRKFKSSSH